MFLTNENNIYFENVNYDFITNDLLNEAKLSFASKSGMVKFPYKITKTPMGKVVMLSGAQVAFSVSILGLIAKSAIGVVAFPVYLALYLTPIFDGLFTIRKTANTNKGLNRFSKYSWNDIKMDEVNAFINKLIRKIPNKGRYSAITDINKLSPAIKKDFKCICQNSTCKIKKNTFPEYHELTKNKEGIHLIKVSIGLNNNEKTPFGFIIPIADYDSDSCGMMVVLLEQKDLK